MTKQGVKVATADDVRNLVLGACGTCNLFKYITDTIKPNKEPRAFDQDIQKYDAVATGQIDGALGDVPVILAKTKDPKYAGTVAACKFQPAVDNAWILPKDSKIIDQVNQIITDLKNDGTLATWEKQYVTPLSGGVDPNTVPDCPKFS
jgi:ABC-type amino acid transport substrate-binding protein